MFENLTQEFFSPYGLLVRLDHGLFRVKLPTTNANAKLRIRLVVTFFNARTTNLWQCKLVQ